MKTTVIRGHGGVFKNNNPITLENGQYVIFPGKCGMPGSTHTILSADVRRVLANRELLGRFIRGNLNRSKFPIEFRPILIGPGKQIPNSVVIMKNTLRFPGNVQRSMLHRWVNGTTGIWNLNKNGSLTYKEGRGNTRRVSNIIGNRPGVYYIDACRVKFGMTQNEANKMLRNIQSGKNVFVKNLKNVINREGEIMRRFTKKRPRPEENIQLRKVNRPATAVKRRRLIGAPKTSYQNIKSEKELHNIFRRMNIN